MPLGLFWIVIASRSCEEQSDEAGSVAISSWGSWSVWGDKAHLKYVYEVKLDMPDEMKNNTRLHKLSL